MKLVYLTSGGRERVLSAIIDAGHEVEAVVVTPAAKWPRVKATIEIARERQIPVYEVSKPDVPELAGLLKGKIGLSAGFAFLLPPAVIASAKLLVNVHGTLLPDYSGARTLGWIIVNEEKESGVTVHVIDAGVDTGPIVLQRRFLLDPVETYRSLMEKTLAFEPHVVLEALTLIQSESFKPVQQTREGKRYPDRTPDDCQLDPKKSLAELLPKILAADPDKFPAFFDYRGHRMKISVEEHKSSVRSADD